MRRAVAWLVFWLVAAGVVAAFYKRVLWFPPAVSEHGLSMDSQFSVSFLVIGTLFVAAQALFGYAVLRGRGKSGQPPSFWPSNPRFEKRLILAIVGVFSMGSEKAWANMYFRKPSPDALEIELTAEQFAWNVRYPGADGQFGDTAPKFITRANPIGLNPSSRSGGDDLVLLNEVRVPAQRRVRLTLRSKDVLHSFWVPNLRLKQDIVPGLAIQVEFLATKTGQFEIACAELCGLGHFRMKGTLIVMEAQEFDQWLEEESE
ncbi:MAG: hypothetical protein HYU36_12465 [Planctomycetes bacterium]|nr:hypothetical protein [Planctomycetota bacterium]